MSGAEAATFLWVVVLVSVLAGVLIGLLGGWLITRLPTPDDSDPDGNARLDAIETGLDEDGPISGEAGERP